MKQKELIGQISKAASKVGKYYQPLSSSLGLVDFARTSQSNIKSQVIYSANKFSDLNKPLPLTANDLSKKFIETTPLSENEKKELDKTITALPIRHIQTIILAKAILDKNTDVIRALGTLQKNINGQIDHYVVFGEDETLLHLACRAGLEVVEAFYEAFPELTVQILQTTNEEGMGVVDYIVGVCGDGQKILEFFVENSLLPTSELTKYITEILTNEYQLLQNSGLNGLPNLSEKPNPSRPQLPFSYPAVLAGFKSKDPFLEEIKKEIQQELQTKTVSPSNKPHDQHNKNYTKEEVGAIVASILLVVGGSLAYGKIKKDAESKLPESQKTFPPILDSTKDVAVPNTSVSSIFSAKTANHQMSPINGKLGGGRS